jgi:hypothetical protein
MISMGLQTRLATVHREPDLARRFFNRFEPVHGVTYFAPEARAALDGLGYRGYWMGYFAARSAPLGEVAPEVVTAIFYNFAHAAGRQGVAGGVADRRPGGRVARPAGVRVRGAAPVRT